MTFRVFDFLNHQMANEAICPPLIPIYTPAAASIRMTVEQTGLWQMSPMAQTFTANGRMAERDLTRVEVYTVV